MKIILSIKPEFAEKIFDGTKMYEFRRSLFKNSAVKSVIVYASAPISKIIGEFEIEEVLYKNLNDLWTETKEFSGIQKSFYMSYFEGKDSGYAIKVKKTKKYRSQYCIKEKYGMKAPQSFAYVND